MPPAPTSIATAPSPRSSVFWNPAVPPPPVIGAWVGTWPGDEVVVVGCAAAPVALAVAVGVGVGVGVGPGAACAGVLVGDDVLPGDFEVPEDAVLLADVVLLADADVVPDSLGEVCTDGVKTVGEDVDEEVQADTATRASRVSAPQQRAVSLAARGSP